MTFENVPGRERDSNVKLAPRAMTIGTGVGARLTSRSCRSRIGYRFRDIHLLHLALTHGSANFGKPGAPITTGWNFSATGCSASPSPSICSTPTTAPEPLPLQPSRPQGSLCRGRRGARAWRICHPRRQRSTGRRAAQEHHPRRCLRGAARRRLCRRRLGAGAGADRPPSSTGARRTPRPLRSTPRPPCRNGCSAPAPARCRAMC